MAKRSESGVNHTEMCVLGVARGHIPGGASQIGIMRVILQPSVSFGFPESRQPVESDLLDGAIVRVGRTGPSVIIRRAIDGERVLLVRPPFETCVARSGMHHGQVEISSSVGANHELRSRCHEVVSTTIAPKRIRKKDEFIGQQFVVPGDRNTAISGARPDGPAPDSVALNAAASGCKKRIKSLESSGGFSDGTFDHIARCRHVM